MELMVPIENKDSIPLYEQIYRYIKTEIRAGRLRAGSRLPSTRTLADNLHVSRSTTQLAYEQLLSEGYIEALPCRGYFVCQIEELVEVKYHGVPEEKEEKQEGEGKGYIFQSTGKKYVVQQIMKYMEENYREKISLEQIAANMYLSSFYIAKIFKSETGDTPINYLIRLRMEKAKELLRNTDWNNEIVSEKLGYASSGYFIKLFKKTFSMTPREFRKASDL